MNKSDSIVKLRARAMQTMQDAKIEDNKKLVVKLSKDAELELYQIELEMQNRDLLEAEIEREKILSKYLNLFNMAPIGYFTLNINSLIVEVNQVGANLLGLEKSSLIDKCFSRYIAPESQQLFSSYMAGIFADLTLKTCEIKLLNRGGALFYAELKGHAVVNNITDEKESLIIVTNIADRKQAEWSTHYNQKQLAVNDRNNSMHELASVIAHEINNPLAVILNYVQGCIRRIETGNANDKDILYGLKEAVKQSSRVSEIILRLKNFKNQGMLKIEVISINTLIKEIISLIQYEIVGFPISIVFRPSQLPDVHVDKIHIQQVILNLARNAIEAMRDANTQNPQLIIETNRINVHEIEVSVIDSGPGFASDTIHQLFDPHYTTKNYGVGLGLAVSQSIIKAHGGELNAAANPVGGACFTFTLKSQAKD